MALPHRLSDIFKNITRTTEPSGLSLPFFTGLHCFGLALAMIFPAFWLPNVTAYPYLLTFTCPLLLESSRQACIDQNFRAAAFILTPKVLYQRKGRSLLWMHRLLTCNRLSSPTWSLTFKKKSQPFSIRDVISVNKQLKQLLQHQISFLSFFQYLQSSQLFYLEYNMIPFKKIFTLFVRTFSRPMLEYFKQQHRLKHRGVFGGLFVSFGRRIFVMETWVNHRVLRSQAHFKTADHKEEIFLEKGIETFSEIIMYLIILGIPFWEMYKSTVAGHEEERRLKGRLLALDKKLSEVNRKISKVAEVLKSSNDHGQMASIASKLKKNDESQKSIEEDSQQINPEAVGVGQLLQNAIDVVGEQFEQILDDFSLTGSSVAEAGEGGQQTSGSAFEESSSNQISTNQPIAPSSETDYPSVSTEESYDGLDVGSLEVEVETSSLQD